MNAALPLLLGFLLALAGLLGGFALSLHGWSVLERRSRLEGFALMASGWLLGIAAMTLLRLGPAPGAAGEWF